MYGKHTECAIAVLSRLAELYDDGKTKLDARAIAKTRNLQAPFVAKVLTSLAHAGLVKGFRGPTGGFVLARHPKSITLRQVYDLFERTDASLNCPFGGGVCGGGEPCPLHDVLVQVQRDIDRCLETNFDCFRLAYQQHGLRAAEQPRIPHAGPRTAFRARSAGASKRL
ncbi:MAG: Rrf2 family transcriptional regulator [Planctomycetes bacterium]|nr:Rrf2 family transcriptional regulator [Planctomycetota bacterium]